jgi:nucleotide-binding universal stress UspA family protein
MFNKILVPLDGSRFGSRAIKYAEEIAHRFGSKMYLVQVIKPAVPMTGSAVVGPGEDIAAAKTAVQIAQDEDKRNAAKAKRYLQRKSREIRQHQVVSSHIVLVGKPASSITGFAQQNKIDLIVMTSHGKGGLKRAILGSVADEVMRESGKPVLVFNPSVYK